MLKQVIILAAFLIFILEATHAQFANNTNMSIDQINNNTGVDIILNPTSAVKVNNFTGGFALQSGALKELEESAVTNTELGFISGATSNLQAQIDGKQASLPATTDGDLIYFFSGVFQRLGIGSENQVLKVNSGIPSWQNESASSPSFTTVTKTASTTLLSSGEDNIICDSSSASVVLTLPAASGNSGVTYRITNLVDANSCTIDANASETIGGELTVVMQSKEDTIIITSDGSNWFYISDQIDYSARYRSDNGQAIDGGGTIEYEDLVRDTHNAYSSVTGDYTIPIDGLYLVKASITVNSLNISSGQFISLRVDNNGNQQDRANLFGNGNNVDHSIEVVSIIYASKGDLVDIKATSSIAASLEPGAQLNVFSISRIKQ